MTNEEKLDLEATIDNEGFDYAFRHYSDFGEFADPEFHRLRQEYVKAAEALEAYIEPREASS
jgi:hypothetical protein